MLSDDLNGKPPVEEKQPIIIIPVCGKCGAGRKDPWPHGAPLTANEIFMGRARMMIVICGNPTCGVIHSVQCLEIAIPQQAPGPAKSLIIPPGSAN